MGRTKSLRVGDIVGQGNLEVLETETRQEGNTKRGFSKVRCKFCGSETWKRNNILKRHRTYSCGCQKRDSSTWTNSGPRHMSWRLPYGESAFNNLFYQYIRSAKKRGYSFDLDKESFRKITKKNCHYCGGEPNRVIKGQGKTSGDYIYNGIDRIDNSIGYIEDNIVPCCFICNSMKHTLSVEDFLKHIETILIHSGGTRLA